MLPLRNETRFPALLLLAASCALSALAALRDPLIDADAIDTLVAAQAVAVDWSGSLAGPAPLHALLIAVVHGATGFALPASARLFALLALGFARLVTLVGRDQRFYGWAALALLLFPPLNGLRGHLLPDAGYWAFLACALAVLARYRASPRWQDAFAWAALVGLAACFRAEAATFALVLPLACLPRDPIEGIGGGTLRLYAALGAIALIPLLTAARLGGLDELADRVLPSLTTVVPATLDGFSGAVARFAEAVLGTASTALAPIALAAALLVVLALSFVAALGLPYGALLAWALLTRRAAIPDTSRRSVAHALVGGGLLIALARLGRTQGLEARELMPLVLAALVNAAFAARELLGVALRSRHPALARVLLGLLVAALFAQGFVSLGARTSHRSESIAWMQANLPREARVFSNDRQLAWYSERAVDWTTIAGADEAILARSAPLENTDYWLIRAGAQDLRLAAALGSYLDVLEPVARFAGPDGEQVLVLRRRD
jgi:hypothetical protein